MANLDTALKRLSGINVSSPWRGMLPLPDASVDQPDRQVVPFMYSGIQASNPVSIPLRQRTLTGVGL